MADRVSSHTIERIPRGNEWTLRDTLRQFHLIRSAKAIHHLIGMGLAAGVRLLPKLAAVPIIGSYVVLVLDRVDDRGRWQFDLPELKRVGAAMASSNIPHWVGGGWGLDILLGSQTSRHGDLDLVLGDFWAGWFPDAAEGSPKGRHTFTITLANGKSCKINYHTM